ncbi:hypothetical protein G9F31_00320 [Acinetobacter sp. 187]|uniref:hypothetical protein n=1 Tax=Acinetobacter lanii TaxID=2715163 RepID=UPI00140E209C|nr:hypothetical protein [Acinetobacter lanii]NHC02232.1 hypothetical protein [Acinetobacter lanii]
MQGKPYWSYYHAGIGLNLFFNFCYLYILYEAYYIKHDLNLLSFFVIVGIIIYHNYQFVSCYTWLNYGKEVIKINASEINIIKYKKSQKLRVHCIKIEEIKNVEYHMWWTRYPPFLPNIDHGNLSITTKNRSYAFAIKFSEEECKLLQDHLKYVLNIPNIVY